MTRLKLKQIRRQAYERGQQRGMFYAAAYFLLTAVLAATISILGYIFR